MKTTLNANVEIHNAGFVLGCIKNLLDSNSKLSEKVFLHLEKMCAFEIKKVCSGSDKNEIENDELLKITKIYNNIIQRGLPTYASLSFERQLCESVKDYFSIIEEKDSGRFDFYFKNSKSNFTTWKNLFETAITVPDLQNHGEVSEALICLLYVPIAIARIQVVLLMLIEDGYLKQDQDYWEICIIENDVPCGCLAVLDFLQYYDAISDLLNISDSLPKIKLSICQPSRFVEFDSGANQICESDRVSVKFIKKTECYYSNGVVIDISLFNDNDTFEEDNFIHENIKLFRIRSSNEFRNTRVISSSERIKYNLGNCVQEKLSFFLQNIFRKTGFWDGQVEIIQKALSLNPVIGLLPTGSGKSLCYQLAGLLQPGICLVVDPLVSLMVDQVNNLKNDYLIDTTKMINSLLPFQERKIAQEELLKGSYHFVFIAPERLQSSEFRSCLSELSKSIPIPYLVIDEAHCVSEWGHDFRTSYLNLASTARKHCSYNNQPPILLALTGTASYAVLEDVQREIGIVDSSAIVSPETFDRPELEFEVISVLSIGKRQKLLDLLREIPSRFNMPLDDFYKVKNDENNAGIIFFPHVNGLFGVIENRNLIENELNLPIMTYSGGGSPNKQLAHQKFKDNEINLLAATKAFGMGIDKPNIRFTIHFNIPPSLEAYYQEAGRAGRDRQKAMCFIIFSDDNAESSDESLDISNDIEDIRNVNEPSYIERGDVHRLLWFHNNTFQGKDLELAQIMSLLTSRSLKIYKKLGEIEIGKKIKFRIPFGSEPNITEKAIYRLGIIGVVNDYTVDYSNNCFEVDFIRLENDEYINNLKNYIARYRTYTDFEEIKQQVLRLDEKGILLQCSKYLLDFVYQEIEKKRRTAIRTMVEVCRQASQEIDKNQFFRKELLSYLEENPFTYELLQIAKSDEPSGWWEILNKVDGGNQYLLLKQNAAQELLGSCRRTLESYPDHPGLNLVSGLARLFLPKTENDLIINDFVRGLRLMNAYDFHEKIDIGENLILQLLFWKNIMKFDKGILLSIFEILLEYVPSKKLARLLINETPRKSKNIIVKHHLENLKKLNSLLEGKGE